MANGISINDALAQVNQLLRAGQFDRAEAMCRKLTAVAPQIPEFWHHLALVYLVQMKAAPAETSLRQAVALAPHEAQYWANLSLALRAQRRPGEGEWYIRRALSLESSRGGFWNMLGGVLTDQRRFVEAIDAYRQALARDKNDASAWCGLAVCYVELEAPGEAREAFERSLTVDPANSEVLIRYATFLARRGEPARAMEMAQRVLAHSPHMSAAWLSLGAAHQAMGEMTLAETAFRKAVELDPQSEEARLQLAEVLQMRWSLTEAEACVRPAIATSPQSPQAWTQLGLIQHAMGRIDEALVSLRKSLTIWRDAPRHGRLLTAVHSSESISAEDLLAMHRQWDALYARPLETSAVANATRAERSGQLRTGFVGDFELHRTRCLVLPLLRSLDRTKCFVACYSDAGIEGAISDEVRNAVDLWRPARHLTSEELAEQIRMDEIDILVDLMAHTGGRLLTFARRAAPVQVAWGYCGTTGLAAMDFLIADKQLVREGEESWYRETVLRLPDGYTCYGPPMDAPPLAPLPALAAGRITFGCFGSPKKYSTETLDAWSEIMSRAPGSQLLLKHGGLDQPVVQDWIRKQFARRGIDPTRILLEGHSLYRDLLAAYSRVDLALDTQPFSGGLTTLEALWMGVPVITYPGRTFASRRSTSHLIQAGCEQFVAADRAHYIDLTVQWTYRLEDLAAIRLAMRQRVACSSLCDSKRFAAEFLKTLQAVWSRRAASIT